MWLSALTRPRQRRFAVATTWTSGRRSPLRIGGLVRLRVPALDPDQA